MAQHQRDRLLDLLGQYGEWMSGAALWRTLGFQTARSFQRSAQRGALPVATFKIEGRRGAAAQTRDVARWLDSLKSQQTEEEGSAIK